jgi:uncharacterized repeat protein (TIGR01451 family)
MKPSRPRHRIHSITKLPHLLTRLVLVSSIATLGSGNLLTAVMALPPTPGTEIKNTAVGSFLDEDAPAANTSTVVESNEVSVTVTEVAGITITSGGIAGSTVAGGLAYFDFIITNVGNDPTQFFIPGSATITGSGTQLGKIKIIGYDSDGSGATAEVLLDVTVPLNNIALNSGDRTGTLLSTDATANNGSIPAGGTIRIRVPIQIDAVGALGTNVSVMIGDTTPANGQNQTYTVSTGNKDVYTVDNSNSVSGETFGVLPQSAQKEASTTQTLSVINAPPDPAAAGANFACDPYFYMLRNDSNGDSQLYKIDRQSSPYSQSLVIGAGFLSLNALGYNPIDGYFYAMSSSSTSYNVLYKIGRSNAVSLGVVSNLPGTGQFINGTFDKLGNYYVKTGPGTTFYKIAVSSTPPTATATTAVSGLDPSGDIAFNPIDGYFYSVGRSGNNILVNQIKGLTTNTPSFTPVPVTNPAIAGGIGAVFFDSVGTLYAYSDSATGVNAYLYQIPNVAFATAATPSIVTQVSQAANSGSSDGASCPFIPPRIDVVKSVGTVTKVNPTTFDVPFTIKVGNAGSNSSPNIQVTENLVRAFSTTPTISVPTLPTIMSTPSGICTLNPSFDGKTAGQMKLLTGTNTLPGGASCTISFTVRLTYGSVGAIPTAVQNNSVYASTTINPNPGHTFATDAVLTPIYPPDLFDADTSNNSSALPLSVHTDPATPTPITLPTSSNPNVLLVKRITAINGLPNRTTGESIADYEPFNTYDDNTISIPAVIPPDTDKWPNPVTGFLVGTTNGGNVKPNDSIEYTIYFLSAGDSTANNVLLCDRVPANVTFNPNTFTSTTANPSGAARGIAVKLGSNPLSYYTNAADNDFARYFPPGLEPNTVYPNINCGRDPLYPNDPTKFLPNNNGAVVVNLGNQSTGAYGFVRFRGVVK